MIAQASPERMEEFHAAGNQRGEFVLFFIFP
jgi:hypothetical protein